MTVNLIGAFVLTFVPLFIVFDVWGNLPVVISITEDISKGERNRIIHIAVGTAAIVGLAFLFFGQFILKIMGISVGAFAIAGGIILLVFSIRYMMTGRVVEVVKQEMVAVVPIGTPLLAGPATITTLLILVSQYPLYMVVVSFALNVIIAWVLFLFSGQVIKVLGQGGLRAISNVLNLLLAAIAVNLIIKGLSLLNILKV
jgi:multiple antibiotic resistance protein